MYTCLTDKSLCLTKFTQISSADFQSLFTTPAILGSTKLLSQTSLAPDVLELAVFGNFIPFPLDMTASLAFAVVLFQTTEIAIALEASSGFLFSSSFIIKL